MSQYSLVPDFSIQTLIIQLSLKDIQWLSVQGLEHTGRAVDVQVSRRQNRAELMCVFLYVALSFDTNSPETRLFFSHITTEPHNSNYTVVSARKVRLYLGGSCSGLKDLRTDILPLKAPDKETESA